MGSSKLRLLFSNQNENRCTLPDRLAHLTGGLISGANLFRAGGRKNLLAVDRADDLFQFMLGVGVFRAKG
jgi:hypothetical protein